MDLPDRPPPELTGDFLCRGLCPSTRSGGDRHPDLPPHVGGAMAHPPVDEMVTQLFHLTGHAETVRRGGEDHDIGLLDRLDDRLDERLVWAKTLIVRNAGEASHTRPDAGQSEFLDFSGIKDKMGEQRLGQAPGVSVMSLSVYDGDAYQDSSVWNDGITTRDALRLHS